MFAVEWSDEAFDQMTGIVARHPGRRAELAAALRALADRLSADPFNEGESREDEFRITFPRPLTVYFRAEQGFQSVRVVRVALTG